MHILPDDFLSVHSLQSTPYRRGAWVLRFQNPGIAGHDPFVPRKFLVLLAAIPGSIATYLLWNFWAGAAIYFVLVTFLDWVSHCLLKIKPSFDSDPEKLLASEGVTPQEFDAYFEKRFWIRCIGLSNAFVLGFLALWLVLPSVLHVFCGMYILSTLGGILGVRFFLKIPRPRLFYRSFRELSYCPYSRTPGRMSTAEFSLATTGQGPMGCWE